MADPLDPARYVPEAAALVGLTIAPGDVGEVTQAFAVLARAAAQLMALDVPEEMIAAALFTPNDGAAR
jgi:Protein of unknown function (DUF4089)